MTKSVYDALSTSKSLLGDCLSHIKRVFEEERVAAYAVLNALASREWSARVMITDFRIEYLLNYFKDDPPNRSLHANIDRPIV